MENLRLTVTARRPDREKEYLPAHCCGLRAEVHTTPRGQGELRLINESAEDF